MRIREYFFMAALSVVAIVGASAQAPVPADSRVVAVTVYADRALVTRQADVSLAKGESTLVFSGLPAETDPASLQVRGKGAFTLRDVRISTRQLSRDVSDQVKALENEKRGYEERIAAVNDRMKEAEAERQFIAEMVKRLTSNAGASESLPLDTAAWAKMLDFQRSRNAAVNDSIRASRKNAQELQVEIDRVNREIRALGTGSRLSVTEAEVVLDAPTATKARLEISYLVSGASWRPDYVVRADSEGSALSVHYRALVRQNTGESWDAAAVSLSTARPQAGGSLPGLSPWYVDVYRPQVFKAESAKSSRAMAAEAPSAAAESIASFDEAAPAMQFATSAPETGATAVLFSIPGATSIASDNRDRTVTVAVLELPVKFSYAAVPKLSPYAYFRAEAVNQSDFPFLPGASHVYVDGSYVADAYMDSVPPGGTFKADLGIDESVKVERKLVRKFDETTGLISKKSRTTWEYAIKITNSKKREIVLVLTDQLPVSVNDQIVVKAIAPAWSKDTDTLRKLEYDTFEWTLKLGPGQETSLQLSFSVEYPKGTPISGLE